MLLFGSIIGIVLFVIVCAYCSKTDSSSNNSSNSNRYYSGSNVRNYDSSYDDDFLEQTNYDPTWDDAYFEKTGRDPWFDDNPWDHEKK